MSFFLNQTEQYHKNDMNDLMWEVTVCNSIEPETSPVRQILAKNSTYGEHLAAYLSGFIPPASCHNVMEVGGGYGYLMRDLLKKYPGINATMVDISPAMITCQRKTLAAFDICCLQSDFFDIDPGLIKTQDLVVMNEIVGDFTTACQLTRDMVTFRKHENKSLERICQYITRGIIDLPEEEPFNLNIGAMMALDKVCSLNVPYIFLSEHSCEAAVNDHMAPYIKLNPTGNPEEIRLYGHSEYTIRFSHLEGIARSFGYTVVRGNYTDFLKIHFSKRIHKILKSNSQKDTHEIIRQFIEDLYIYEYLLLIQEH